MLIIDFHARCFQVFYTNDYFVHGNYYDHVIYRKTDNTSDDKDIVWRIFFK